MPDLARHLTLMLVRCQGLADRQQQTITQTNIALHVRQKPITGMLEPSPQRITVGT